MVIFSVHKEWGLLLGNLCYMCSSLCNPFEDQAPVDEIYNPRGLGWLEYWACPMGQYPSLLDGLCTPVSSTTLTLYMLNWFKENIFAFLPFLNIVMTQVNEVHLHRRRVSLCPILSIPLLLMAWRHKEPGHHSHGIDIVFRNIPTSTLKGLNHPAISMPIMALTEFQKHLFW